MIINNNNMKSNNYNKNILEYDYDEYILEDCFSDNNKYTIDEYDEIILADCFADNYDEFKELDFL